MTENGEYASSIGDGYSAQEIFRGGKTCQAFTYDDIILMPGNVFFSIKYFWRTQFF